MKSATVYEQPYISGDHFGLPRSTLVHRLANITGVIQAGENCRIDAFVTITGDLVMGDNCHIGTGVAVYAAAGFEMGEGCALSPGAKVFTVSEDVDSGLVSSHAQSALERAALAGAIKFGCFVVIGANSVVLPGVTVGDQVQVGALSLVNRDLPGQGIYVGAPARLLRARPPLRYGR